MKRNRKLNAYGRATIAAMEGEDRQSLQEIRGVFRDVHAFTKGLVVQLGSEYGRWDGSVDYSRMSLNVDRHVEHLEKYTKDRYNDVAHVVGDTSKSIYVEYRKRIEKTLESVGFSVKAVAVKEGMSLSFGGTPNESFLKQLERQNQLGYNPADLIKTVGRDHIKLIQTELTSAIAQGKGFGWAKDKVMGSLFPDASERLIQDTMEYNVTRIMRTSYMQAVNRDTMGILRGNAGAFIGARRVADGRPCMACIVLDGQFYPPDVELEDHPNGMCLLVPVPYPDEYLLTGQMTRPAEDTFDTPLLQKFYDAAEDEQRRLMGNSQLFNLWKEEQFDLTRMPTGKFGTSMTYTQAVMNLENLGGISAPGVEFLKSAELKSLNPFIDPRDRADVKGIVSRTKPGISMHKWGLDPVGDGSDFWKSPKVPIAMKARVSALYGEAERIPWTMFNERARLLGIATRMDSRGKFYYMLKKSDKDKFVLRSV
jgi:hypothetical protein